MDKFMHTPYFLTLFTFFTRAPVFRGGALPRAAFCTRWRLRIDEALALGAQIGAA